MSTVLDRPAASELHTGDRMTQREFHRIYSRMPEHFRAELVGGIVYVATPLKRQHGTIHAWCTALFVAYSGRTAGTETGDNASVILGELGEPQPDLYLRILPEYGGQSRTTKDDYVDGAPELVAEVAYSSRSIDLHAKHDDYQEYGVCEYLVVDLHGRRLRWFDLVADEELAPDADGIIRLRTFPGLWIDPEALFGGDFVRLMKVLDAGLASREHAAFVKRLKARRTRK